VSDWQTRLLISHLDTVLTKQLEGSILAVSVVGMLPFLPVISCSRCCSGTFVCMCSETCWQPISQTWDTPEPTHVSYLGRHDGDNEKGGVIGFRGPGSVVPITYAVAGAMSQWQPTHLGYSRSCAMWSTRIRSTHREPAVLVEAAGHPQQADAFGLFKEQCYVEYSHPSTHREPAGPVEAAGASRCQDLGRATS
jgi:hypothetical protein